MMSAGSTVKLHTILRKTPLARTKPRSVPTLSFIKMSISRLTIVVRALLRMEGAASFMAFSIALTLSGQISFCCRKRFISMME